jgi:hypothetical protein
VNFLEWVEQISFAFSPHANQSSVQDEASAALSALQQSFGDTLPSNEQLVAISTRTDLMSLDEFVEVYYTPVDYVPESGAGVA